MKDELQMKLVEVLAAIQSTAGRAGDFAMEQLPEIAQSYVMYGRVYNTVAVLVFALAPIVIAWALARLWRATENDLIDGDHPLVIMSVLCGGTGALISAAVACSHLSSLLLVWFAPKVWLLKEIAILVR